MTFDIIAVHPTIAIVHYGDQRLEIPTSWFPESPQVGQRWQADFKRLVSSGERYSELNQLISDDK